MPPSARLSIKAIYNRIRNEEGFRGNYGSVKDYARLIASDKNCIWEYAYDLRARSTSYSCYPVSTHRSFREAVRSAFSATPVG